VSAALAVMIYISPLVEGKQKLVLGSDFRDLHTLRQLLPISDEGLNFSAHDPRITLATLAHKGGSQNLMEVGLD
jgi:hypothetical protein